MPDQQLDPPPGLLERRGPTAVLTFNRPDPDERLDRAAEGAKAGLRPDRVAIGLGRVEAHAVPVVACYGHGGAGVTLSRGCAEAVTDLVAAV